MKYSIIFTSVITLALTSQVVTAGSIADTYATGDTLTATKMENIKTAVNDNDGDIITNTNGITANDSDIANNAIGIGANATNIVTNTNGITANDSDIANNVIGIGANAGNISSNTTEIGINTLGIANNASNIEVNVGNISSNTDEVVINTQGIADNAENIAASSRFYGDGSAGELTISSSTSWTGTLPTGNNLNFTNIVIDAGVILTVPAGTTIRCTGSFTNNGTLVVYIADNNGSYIAGSTTDKTSRVQLAGVGDALLAAGNPALTLSTNTYVYGGLGGKGIPKAMAASSFNHFRIGGGGGSGTTYYNGGYGGGLVKIYCAGDIINNGNVNADGQTNTSAGGGGGIVILASASQVINDALATISANGADGYDTTIYNGANGGGGGGIIIMVAPSITNDGATSFTGGAGGAVTTNVTYLSAHSGGGGGGASGGRGGYGASVNSSNVSGTGGAGGNGYILQILSNPANMMN